MKLEWKNGKKMWRKNDPRFDINKRASIIIARPSMRGQWLTGTAHVDTKEGWSIITSFEDHRSIDKWDPDWTWCFAPDDTIK